jgi:Flp pilus assembly protein TadD
MLSKAAPMTHRPRKDSRQLADLGARFQISVYEDHLSTRPDDADVLEALGHVLTKSGRHREGLAADRKLVELRPDEPVAHYNLACSLALVGDHDAALERLRVALTMGFRDLPFIRKDRDLASLRQDPRFEALLGEFAKSPKDQPSG